MKYGVNPCSWQRGELDALDNGVQVAEEPRYRIVTHLGARVGRLNPGWQEESSPEMENKRFKEALKLAAKESQ